MRLKSLQIIEHREVPRALLACPSLENLKLWGDTEILGCCFESLNVSCPKLKRLSMGRRPSQNGYREWKMAEDLKFKHETLEELELHNFSFLDVHVDCFNLKKLVVKQVVADEAPMAFLSLGCPNITCLELDGSAHVLVSIPSMLSALPGLEALTIKKVAENIKDVAFAHGTIRNFVVVKTDS